MTHNLLNTWAFLLTVIVTLSVLLAVQSDRREKIAVGIMGTLLFTTAISPYELDARRTPVRDPESDPWD